MKVSTTFKGTHFRKRLDEIPTGINHPMTTASLDYDIVKNRQKKKSFQIRKPSLMQSSITRSKIALLTPKSLEKYCRRSDMSRYSKPPTPHFTTAAFHSKTCRSRSYKGHIRFPKNPEKRFVCLKSEEDAIGVI
jgi:hypothetical protein